MSGEIIGMFIDKAVMVLVGLWCVYQGYLRTPPEEPKQAEWHRRFRTFFRIGGPLLVLIGVALVVMELCEYYEVAP